MTKQVNSLKLILNHIWNFEGLLLLAKISHKGRMIYISWNSQGLGSHLTVRALKDLVRRYKPNFVFLMDTKNKKDKVEKLQRSLKFEQFYS